MSKDSRKRWFWRVVDFLFTPSEEEIKTDYFDPKNSVVGVIQYKDDK